MSMVLLKFSPGRFAAEVAPEITGWIVGSDAHDLRRQLDASALGDPHDVVAQKREVVSVLYRRELFPDGKHDLGNGYVLLVSR